MQRLFERTVALDQLWLCGAIYRQPADYRVFVNEAVLSRCHECKWHPFRGWANVGNVFGMDGVKSTMTSAKLQHLPRSCKLWPLDCRGRWRHCGEREKTTAQLGSCPRGVKRCQKSVWWPKIPYPGDSSGPDEMACSLFSVSIEVENLPNQTYSDSF